MNFYQEITLIRTNEEPFFTLWSKLFTQIHLALVEQAKASYGEDATTSDIGVSFPEYHSFTKEDRKITILGAKLRVFAKTEAELQSLNLSKWCERLLDYVHIRSIAPVKEATSHITVQRIKQIKNNDRLTRSFAKRKDMSFENAKAKRIELFAQRHNVSTEESALHYENPTLKNEPYIKLTSLQTKHSFSLFIQQQEKEMPVQGTFSTYGLSSTTTVPHW